MATSKVYIIGDKETGVLLILLNPLRAAIFSRTEIQRFAETSETYNTPEKVFAWIAEASTSLVHESDDATIPAANSLVSQAFGAMIARGATISDAEFCLIADVHADNWDTLRGNFVPLGAAMTVLGGAGDARPPAVVEVKLEDF
jgi:hypothetical protein